MSGRWRGPAFVAGVLALGLGLGLLLVRPNGDELLDPRSAAPTGGRALVNVLRDHGIDVRLRDRFSDVRTDLLAAGSHGAVVLARPDRLGAGRAEDLARLAAGAGSDLVVLGARSEVLSGLGLPVSQVGQGDGSRRPAPRCSAPLPARAGTADVGDGAAYRPESTAASVQTCYPLDGVSDAAAGSAPASAYVELTEPGDRRTTLLGTGVALTNDRLAAAGNAALGVGALGRRDVLVWWTPDPLDGAPQATRPSLAELLPPGVRFGALQLLVVLAVVVVWRARRFGRLVPEPLPVVVRAIENTRGRAQLYRRARAGGRAAQVLRAATVRRLATRVGLGRSAPPQAVAAAVAAATGRPEAEVRDLLVGDDPPDAATLVRLARDLHALEEEVHRP